MRALRALFLARSPHVIVLAAGFVCAEYMRNREMILAAPTQPLLGATMEPFANWLLMGLSIVAIVSACELFIASGWRRGLVQATALAMAAPLYAYAIGTSEYLTVQYRALGMENGLSLFLYITWAGWAMAALLSAFYRAHEKANTASSALQRAELERERTQQGLLRSRLRVLESRVEPQFLSDNLLRVQGLYAQDPVRADQALDDLIAQLRAAMLATSNDPPTPR